MSTSFWMIFGGAMLLCAFIFTKTISNDARNDYMLRDILSNSSDETDYRKQREEKVLNTQKMQYEETQNQVSVVSAQPSQYSTTMHAEKSDYHTNYGNSVAVKEPEHVQEESYYQKDRCMATDKVNPTNTEPTVKNNIKQEKAEPVQTLPKRASKFLPSDNTEEEYTISEEKPLAVKAHNHQSNGLMHYIKLFWRGITFTLGALACLYGLNMFLSSAAMGADTLVSTLWVLIGVILVK